MRKVQKTYEKETKRLPKNSKGLRQLPLLASFSCVSHFAEVCEEPKKHKYNVLRSSRAKQRRTFDMDTAAIKTSLPHAPLAGQQQPQQAQTTTAMAVAPTTITNAQTSAINAKNNIGAFFQTCKVRGKLLNQEKRSFGVSRRKKKHNAAIKKKHHFPTTKIVNLPI